MNNSSKSSRPIKFVVAGKYENTKNFQIPLKNFQYPDKTGHIRQVVYIPDADTIFANEYKGDLKSQSVWFSDGQLLVRPSDKNLLKILAIHPWRNQRFKKHDPTIEAMEKLSQNDLVKQALKLIDIADDDKLKATAFAVLDGYHFKMHDSIMKSKLEDKAFSHPKWLISELTDPNFHTKQMAALSVLKGILKINPARTAITWPNGKILVSVPPGQDAIVRLGEFLGENTSESKVTLQELGELNKNRHKPKEPSLGEQIEEAIHEKEEEPQTQGVDVEEVKPTPNDDMDIEDLQAAYEAAYEKPPAVTYKNNREWLIKKINEKAVTA